MQLLNANIEALLTSLTLLHQASMPISYWFFALTNRIYVPRHVMFNEFKVPFADMPLSSPKLSDAQLFSLESSLTQ